MAAARWLDRQTAGPVIVDFAQRRLKEQATDAA
jgi:hypothetical protein